MTVVRDVAGSSIRLSNERWHQVVRQHSEMLTQMARVSETSHEPDYVVAGDRGTLMAMRVYERTPVTRKHCVVVYRPTGVGGGFIVTAYFARSLPQRRRIVWPA